MSFGDIQINPTYDGKYNALLPNGKYLLEKDAPTKSKAEDVAWEYFCSKIDIHHDLKKYFRHLDEDEKQTLETSILQEGIRDALVFWREKGDDIYTLIDGHNRYEIAKKWGLRFPFVVKNFKDKKEVLEYMSDLQRGRRNLTTEEKAFYLGKKWQIQKSKGVTSEEFAEENGISRRQVFNDEKFYEGVEALDADFRKEVLSGKANVNRGDLVKLGKALSNEPTKKGIAAFQNIPETGSLIPLPENKIGNAEELHSFLQKEVKKPTKSEPITPTDANTGVLFEQPQVGFKLPKKETLVELSNDYMYVFGFDWAFFEEVQRIKKKGFYVNFITDTLTSDFDTCWKNVLDLCSEFKEFGIQARKYKQDEKDEHKQYIVDAATIEAILRRLSVLNSDIYHKHEAGSRYVIGIPYDKKKDGTINIFAYFKHEKYPQTQASDVQKQFLDNFQKMFLEKCQKEEGLDLNEKRIYELAQNSIHEVHAKFKKV